MDYEKNYLTFTSSEINIIFAGEGRPQLEEEQSIRWEDIKNDLIRIRNTANRVIGGVAQLYYHGQEQVVDQVTVGLSGPAVREVPKALAIFARRSLANERRLAGLYPQIDYSGSIAVRELLVNQLEAVTANPRIVVLGINCVRQDKLPKE